jgi:biotin-(acetyl-CoA carboxylase) ligase
MDKVQLLQDLTSRITPFMQEVSLPLQQCDVVTSTNDWAWATYRASKQQLEPGKAMLFLAESQQKGRGTQGRPWLSPPKSGIYMSVLHTPRKQIPLTISTDIKGSVVPIYSRVAALATWYALSSAFPALRDSVSIRGVNDLCIGDEKLGGHLVETSMSSSGLVHAFVTGTGINCFLSPEFHLIDERNIATCLAHHLTPQDMGLYNIQQLAYLIGMSQMAFFSALEQARLNDLDYYMSYVQSKYG